MVGAFLLLIYFPQKGMLGKPYLTTACSYSLACCKYGIPIVNGRHHCPKQPCSRFRQNGLLLTHPPARILAFLFLGFLSCSLFFGHWIFLLVPCAFLEPCALSLVPFLLFSILPLFHGRCAYHRTTFF